jgi:hypothetical protein
MTGRDLLSLPEVAERTGWPIESLRRDCRNGKIACHRYGRGYYLTNDQYQALLESTKQTTSPTPPTEAEIKAAAIASARTAKVALIARRGAA